MKPGGKRDTVGYGEECQIKEYLMKGMTQKDACFLTGVSYPAWHRYCKENGITKEDIEEMQSNPTRMAKMVVVDDITENKNVISAKWWLEHKASDEFNTKVTSDLNVKPVLPMEDKEQALLEYMKGIMGGEQSPTNNE